MHGGSERYGVGLAQTEQDKFSLGDEEEEIAREELGSSDLFERGIRNNWKIYQGSAEGREIELGQLVKRGREYGNSSVSLTNPDGFSDFGHESWLATDCYCLK